MEIAAVVFVVFLLAVAFITFFVLKRALKMAIRALIVGIIILVAIVGGASLWFFGSDSGAKNPAVIKKKK